MLKNISTVLFLTVFLTACGNSSAKPQTIYVDKVVEVYPPESLLVVPTEPKLPDGTLTNEDIINGYIDMRSAYREVVEQLKGIEKWRVED